MILICHQYQLSKLQNLVHNNPFSWFSCCFKVILHTNFTGMNYLAHAYLSFGFDDILIGNYIADTVKGKHERFPEGIRKGIRLHHLIDEFTDANNHFRKSVSRIDGGFEPYASIIIDMFYDHFLAANWSRYNDISLPKFAEKVYATLLAKFVILPPRMKRMLPHMFTSNWLVYYGDANSFSHFFVGLARRTRYAPDLVRASKQIHEHYDKLNEDFIAFMDEMIAYVKSLKNF
jgi:acyl carrier protein phosphodiesterase